MRAYRYRLQRLLDLRRHSEREVEIRFGAAAGALAAVDRRLDEIQLARVANAVSDVGGEAERAPSADTPVLLDRDALGNTGWYFRRLEQEERQLLNDRERRTDELAAVAAEYAEATRARRVLDKLRDRQQRTHMRDARRAEQAEADELAESRSARDRTLSRTSADIWPATKRGGR